MNIEAIYNEIVKGNFTIEREYSNSAEITVNRNAAVLWFGNNYVNGLTFNGDLKIIDNLKEAKIIYDTFLHKKKFS